jgi:hypothetical protein
VQIDLGLLLAALVFGVWGAWSGALRQALGLAFAAAAIPISLAASSALGKATSRLLDARSYVGPVVAGLCALFLSYLALRLVAGAAFWVARRGETKAPAPLSRMGGFALGFVQALLIGYVALSWSTQTEYETTLVLRPYKVDPAEAWSYRLAETHSALGLFAKLESASLASVSSAPAAAGKPGAPNGAAAQHSNGSAAPSASSTAQSGSNEGMPAPIKAALDAKQSAEVGVRQRMEAADAVLRQ